MNLDTDVAVASRALRAAPVHRIAPGLSWSWIVSGAAGEVVLAAGFGMQIGAFGLGSRASLAAFTPVIGAWAIVAQVVPAALGGYLSGRLRHGWHDVHDDESHFRDTAHGLIPWAVATLVGVVLVALVLGPYSERLAGADMVSAAAALTPNQAERAANISAQAAYFAAVGLLLSAFVSAVAARLGGLRTEEMHPVV